MTGLVAGVDVGGTFTDLVIFDPASGAVRLAKVPTTLPNQSGGVLNAFAEAGAELSGIDLIVHGTTTTTNAVLERQLSKTGLITTFGFRDVLELGRRTRPQAYGMHGQFTRSSRATCGWRSRNAWTRGAGWSPRWTRMRCGWPRSTCATKGARRW